MALVGIAIGWASLALLVHKLGALPPALIVAIWVPGFFWLCSYRDTMDLLLRWFSLVGAIGGATIIWTIVVAASQ